MADTQVLEACAPAWGFESPLPHQETPQKAAMSENSQTFTQPDNTRVTLTKTPEYRDTYANSVQVRLSVWDFLLVFGTLEPTAADAVEVNNFQGIYLSPQQAKALHAILSQNLAQYEAAFGQISLDAPQPGGPRAVPGPSAVH